MENLQNKTHYGCIYKLINSINNKYYIGQSTNVHKVISRLYKGSGKVISLAIKKYGWENFEVEIIEYLKYDSVLSKRENQKILDEKEIFWIKELNSLAPNGYNLTKGGAGVGGLVMVKDKLGNTLSVSETDERFLSGELVGLRKGVAPHNKGIAFSEEVRRKISISTKGKIPHNKGIPFSEEVKKKISIANSGRQVPEHKKNPKITCPHCNKSGRNNIMPRLHFDNCKLK
jgi:group I intron endonuclease